MRYSVNAYLCTNFAGLMDSLETDNFYEVQGFVWKNVQEGHNCEIIDNTIGVKNWVFADDFTEDTIDYADLRMEQQEQM